jgi:endonuclease III
MKGQQPKSPFPIDCVATILRRETGQWKEPIVTRLARIGQNPFKVLISTILSLRTKDETTAQASDRLFALAQTPAEMLALDVETIARTIYPVGFYNVKAKTILQVCRTLIEEYGGEVPASIDELTKMKGVGRKTANLVMTLGFNKPAICVDTHVHRITNRWGYVKTKNPDETELVLRKILPKKYWIPFNDWLVTWGQNVCVPISPFCSRCALLPCCGQVGVSRSR